MKKIITYCVLVMAAAVLTGCVTTGPSDPYKSSLLQDGPAATNGGKDMEAGKKCALIAFNTFVYYDGQGAPAGEKERKEVTAAEMRNLTDAMLQTFLGELTQVKDLQVQPLADTGANKSYKRFYGRRGADILGFALTEPQGLMAAPANLKYLKVANSTGAKWLRNQTEGVTLSSILGKVTGAKSTDGVELEDASLLSYRLKTDFVLMVNNRVRLVRGLDGEWSASLEMVEVLAAGANNLKKFAYAKYADGEFADAASAPKTDPVKPELWKLMAWKPDGKKEKRTAKELAERDFAATPFWPSIAGPYKRVTGVFREDLTKIRQ